MYVCVCNAIKDTELRKAAANFEGDAEAVYQALGCVPQCCQCLDEANEIVDQVRYASSLPVKLSA